MIQSKISNTFEDFEGKAQIEAKEVRTDKMV